MSRYCVILVLIFFVNPIHGQQFEEQSLLTYTRCRVDSDCIRVSNNSFCFDNDDNKIGKCKCLEGYELMTRNKTSFSCLKHAGYGEACVENIQCQITLTINAVCDDNTKTCRCADHAHQFTDGKCYMSNFLGEYCQVDANCWLKDNSFGSCVRGRCACKFDKQVPAEDLLSCIDSRRLGERCNSNSECSITPNAVCEVDCKCGARYTLSKDRTRCLEVATSFFDFCEEHEQCSAYLIGSSCRNNSCSCSDGEHGFGSRCVRSASLGGVCIGMEECISDREYSDRINCIDGICRCLPGVIDEKLGCTGGSRRYIGSEIILVFSMVVLFMRSQIFSDM